LIKEIEADSDICRTLLERLGQPRATLDEQRLYLLHISQHFQSLVKAFVDRYLQRSVLWGRHVRARLPKADSGCRQITTSNDSLLPHGVIAVTRVVKVCPAHLLFNTSSLRQPMTTRPNGRISFLAHLV
jgi:hypothetical protein